MKESSLPSASRNRSSAVSSLTPRSPFESKAAFAPLAIVALAVVALAIAALAPPAAAVGPAPAYAQVRAAEASSARLLLGAPHAIGDLIAVDVALHNAFTDEAIATIRQGTPITLVYTVELWKDRAHWFDKLVTSRSIAYRIAYDIFREEFVAERPGGPRLVARTSAQLVTIVGAEEDLAVAPIVSLEHSSRYYLAGSAVLRPLSIEDLQEVEAWIRGEVKPRSGGVGSYPRAVLDFLVGLSGLGGENLTAQSQKFTLESLARDE